MLPGNTMLHWKVNQPLGNFEIKQHQQRIADMGVTSGDSVPNWVDIGDNLIDSTRQYHLLYFSTNNANQANPPKLTIRVNYTFTSKEK